jgi:hypothetical protein
MSDTEPHSGVGQSEDGALSSPPEHDDEEQLAQDQDSPGQKPEVTGIPLGVPMTEEEWRQAKKRAERPQS